MLPFVLSERSRSEVPRFPSSHGLTLKMRAEELSLAQCQISHPSTRNCRDA